LWDSLSFAAASAAGIAAAQIVSCYRSPMASHSKGSGKSAPISRAIVEICFIVFLFYSNLLMGEFTQTNGQGKSLAFAIKDIFSTTNFTIAVAAALIGYVVFEYLRKQL
jgi:formate-dependent nitrite reductase membrane component NrfD